MLKINMKFDVDKLYRIRLVYRGSAGTKFFETSGEKF